jgi:N-acetylmuramoyl-L-alanine amidase
MRDILVDRRALLALGAGALAELCSFGSAMAQPAGRHVHLRPRKLAPQPIAARIVAVDPGHGGIDPGAISPHGMYEKLITLATARELARQLAASGRYRPMLTRSADVFVPLHERVQRARAAHAELFLSIHADTLANPLLRGLSVYTLSAEASDREAGMLATRENRDDFAPGLRLSKQSREIGAILFDLERRQTQNQALSLARAIVGEMGRLVPLLEKPQRAAGFVVLTAPDIPSALVELACLSNPQDEQLLSRPAYQQRLASGLMRAIDDYFATPGIA